MPESRKKYRNKPSDNIYLKHFLIVKLDGQLALKFQRKNETASDWQVHELFKEEEFCIRLKTTSALLHSQSWSQTIA